MGTAVKRSVEMGYGALARLRNVCGAVLLTSSAAAAEPVVIAAMGDSLTHGYGLNAEDGFVAQMQDWLTDNGLDVQMINAGVSGDTTAGGLSRAAWTLTPEVDAMIVALGANDYLRGIDPVVARQNLSGILDAATEAEVEVLLVGLEVGGNYGPDYKADFDAIYPELSAQYGTLFFETWFEGILQQGGSGLGAAEYFQADGIHPNAKGVALIVSAMGPAVADLARLVE